MRQNKKVGLPDQSAPLYPISTVGKLVGTSPRMIREYEKMGLICPRKINGQRRFSQIEIQFIAAIQYYLDEVGMTLPGLRVLFQMAPCWELKNCQSQSCPAWRNASSKCFELIKPEGSSCRPELCVCCPIFLSTKHKRAAHTLLDGIQFPNFASTHPEGEPATDN